MTLSDEQFETEFKINYDELLDILVEIINERHINSLDMLSVAANVANYVEDM